MRLVSKSILLLLVATRLLAAESIDTRAVDRTMERALAAWKIPGAAVAIVKDDKVVYVKAFGVKEAGGSDPVTTDTLFGIASNSKAFTTAAMAMLVDEKKLSWDDPVRKHVEYFHLSDPCADSTVTLRDLVSHRTGLAGHDELWDNTALTREQVVRAVASLEPWKPIRTSYRYNNIMFMVAGEAVASAAKMPWSEFVKTRIFQPLGMMHTQIGIADLPAADHATGHRWNRTLGRPVAVPLANDEPLGPAGAIKSSANDMAQWLRFQLNDGVIDGKRLVSADALGETKSVQVAIRPSSKERDPESNFMNYGLGWFLQDYRGELLVSHTGWLNGYRSQVAMLPKLHAGFVVLTNETRDLPVVSLKNSLADILLGRPSRDWDAYYLAQELKADAKDDAQKQERAAKRKEGTKPTLDLAAYAGAYENPAYGTATVSLENGALVLHWNLINAPLVHYHYDVFTATSEADGLDEEVPFQLGVDGTVKMLTLFGEEFRKK